jgi:beta-galactosidase
MDRFIIGVLCAFALGAQGADPYLHQLYDKLHDSPTQQRWRKIAPMPFGVVFLPWHGMTEQDMREHFRTMKRLGFHNLKQAMGTPEWPHERVLEVALEEGVIPFWYGEAGFEPITPQLLAKLGLPADMPVSTARSHPKMWEYQKEVLRKQIPVMVRGESKPRKAQQSFPHTPDPFLRDGDLVHFRKWLRENYQSPREIAEAWNQYEVGFPDEPVKTWEDVDALVAWMAALPNTLGGYGREYSRVRDVLRYKADYHAEDLRRQFETFHEEHPLIPTRTGGEMGLFLPFAYRATKMEALAQTQLNTGSFYPSIHMAWHYGEVHYEVARTVYMQSSFARDLFKGGWAAPWESTGGPQQFTGAKGWDEPEKSTTAGYTINAGVMSQLIFSYLAAGFKGVGFWSWNYRPAGFEAGEYALLDRTLKPHSRAIQVGKIAQAANRLRDELWQSHKEPSVGVLLNWDSDAIWAAMSVRQRDHFKHYPMQARVGISRALIDANIPWEYVTVEDLAAGLGPRYKAIYLPAQIAISRPLLQLLLDYAKQGGRVILDAPGGAYDERGKVLPTAKGSLFEQLFGVELSDLAYSNNVKFELPAHPLTGFIHELRPTSAKTSVRFGATSLPAITVNSVGQGQGIVLAYDAGFELFLPGKERYQQQLVSAAFSGLGGGYSCEGAVVYRLAAPDADHYFIINDGPAKQVRLRTPGFSYTGIEDPVAETALTLGAPVELEAYSARWLRLRKK